MFQIGQERVCIGYRRVECHERGKEFSYGEKATKKNLSGKEGSIFSFTLSSAFRPLSSAFVCPNSFQAVSKKHLFHWWVPFNFQLYKRSLTLSENHQNTFYSNSPIRRFSSGSLMPIEIKSKIYMVLLYHLIPSCQYFFPSFKSLSPSKKIAKKQGVSI